MFIHLLSQELVFSNHELNLAQMYEQCFWVQHNLAFKEEIPRLQANERNFLKMPYKKTLVIQIISSIVASSNMRSLCLTVDCPNCVNKDKWRTVSTLKHLNLWRLVWNEHQLPHMMKMGQYVWPNSQECEHLNQGILPLNGKYSYKSHIFKS